MEYRIDYKRLNKLCRRYKRSAFVLMNAVNIVLTSTTENITKYPKNLNPYNVALTTLQEAEVLLGVG